LIFKIQGGNKREELLTDDVREKIKEQLRQQF